MYIYCNYYDISTCKILAKDYILYSLAQAIYCNDLARSCNYLAELVVSTLALFFLQDRYQSCKTDTNLAVLASILHSVSCK